MLQTLFKKNLYYWEKLKEKYIKDRSILFFHIVYSIQYTVYSIQYTVYSIQKFGLFPTIYIMFYKNINSL